MDDGDVFRTRGAEGLDRRGFRVADIVKMIDVGLIDAEEKFELIDGEIAPLNPQAMPHIVMKARIARALLAGCPPDVEIAQDATVMLDDTSFFDADVLVFRPRSGRRFVEMADVLLAVEVTHASHTRDLVVKAPRYGTAGLPELWVAELNEGATYIFRSPQSSSWHTPTVIPFDRPISPLFSPGLEINMSDLAWTD